MQQETARDFASLPTDEEQAQYDAPIENLTDAPNSEQVCPRCGFLWALHTSEIRCAELQAPVAITFGQRPLQRPTVVASLTDRRNRGHTRLL